MYCNSGRMSALKILNFKGSNKKYNNIKKMNRILSWVFLRQKFQYLKTKINQNYLNCWIPLGVCGKMTFLCVWKCFFLVCVCYFGELTLLNTLCGVMCWTISWPRAVISWSLVVINQWGLQVTVPSQGMAFYKIPDKTTMQNIYPSVLVLSWLNTDS